MQNKLLLFTTTGTKITLEERQLLCITSSSLELPVLSPSLPALVLPAVESRDMTLQCFEGLSPEQFCCQHRQQVSKIACKPCHRLPSGSQMPQTHSLSICDGHSFPQDAPMSHVHTLEGGSHSAQAILPYIPIDPIP